MKNPAEAGFPCPTGANLAIPNLTLPNQTVPNQDDAIRIGQP